MAIGNASAPAQRPAVARLSARGLGRLAAWCYDHRRRVLLGWLLVVVAIIGLAQWAGSRLDNNFALAGSPSQQAQNLLAARIPAQKGDSAEVVLRSPGPLGSPASAAAIGALVRSLKPLAHVSGVQGPLVPGASWQLSPGHRIGFVVVQFDATAADLPAGAVWRVIGTARSFARPGLQVAVGGAPVEQVVSAAPGSAEMTCSTGAPPTATCRPGRANPRAVSITRQTAPAGRSAAVASNWTTTKPIRRPGDSCQRAPGASGLCTPETWARGFRDLTRAPMAAALAGLPSGLGERRTTSALSPFWAGNRAASRF